MDFNRPKKSVKKEETPASNQVKKYDFDELDFYGIENADYFIELPLFPDDFETMNGAKRTSDDQINQWIEDCVLHLESDRSEKFASAQSGDAKLIVLRIMEEEDSDSYHYLIEIFRDRHSIEVFPEEL